MNKITVLLLSQVEGNKIHTVNVPEIGEPGFYREGVSFDAFRNNLAKNTYEFMQRERRIPRENYYVQDHRCDPSAGDRMLLEGAEFVAHHENIWELYKAIGYDRKGRRVVGLQP